MTDVEILRKIRKEMSRLNREIDKLRDQPFEIFLLEIGNLKEGFIFRVGDLLDKYDTSSLLCKKDCSRRR
jgi:hypothetical protein